MPDVERWLAYVDGGCYPNPEGTMGIGVHLIDPRGETAAELSARPKELGTNNEAEYRAVLLALEAAFERGARRIEVRGDSRLTVNTLNGRWQLRAEHLLPWKARIDAIADAMDEVRYSWVPRERNKVADRLATEAMGGRVDGGPKHAARSSGPTSRPATPPATAKATADGALCGLCRTACTFRWQTFKNGSRHIRQECPNHGFLRYAPKDGVYAEVANQSPPHR